ncbi:MAG: hypothetical protein GY847_29175 [Proteobacteria bacterium]|nr:hypothetical protein [Pseudomonadota bacterium]
MGPHHYSIPAIFFLPVFAAALAVIGQAWYSRAGDDTIAPETAEDKPSDILPLNSGVLPKLLKTRGYELSPHFKAFVMEIVHNKNGSFSYYPMDYLGTSDDREDWWPASTVKLFAAIAALEKNRAMGFSPRAEVTFNYEEKPLTRQLDFIIKRAIVHSRNPEFDQLVEFVNCDRLNRYFLNPRKGILNTVMLRAYYRRVKYPESGKGSNRHSPEIIIKQGRRSKILPEHMSTAKYDCPENGNCTTPRDLAEAMRRLMMHETLPKNERFKLGQKELELLRWALNQDHKKGGVWRGIKTAYEGRPIKLYHKPGYAWGWFSDNVFLHLEDTDERWIVVMANRSGRKSCDEAAAHLGRLMASGDLSRERSKAFSDN